MEQADRALLMAIPGAMAAGRAGGLFWGSLAAALAVALLVATPVDRRLISGAAGAR